jgi:hypothetical protein
MAVSKGGRTYSDPSYGGVRTLQLGPYTAGTRATAIVDTFTAMSPITILDWEISNSTLGTGGSSQWALCATGAAGTAALGTIIFVGTHAAGAVVAGTATETNLDAGENLHLYSVLSTAAGLTLTAYVKYRERFSVSDN